MASVSKQSILNDLKGQLGKELVFKQYRNKTVVSRRPDMSRVRASTYQKKNRSLFAAAVAYAKEISRNPEKKQLYAGRVADGQTVYHYAIKEFYAKLKQTETLT